MIDLTKLQQRINNSIRSRHETEYLPECEQCGFKPTRGWSHSGAFLGCECNVLTNRNGAGWGTLEFSWKALQGASTENDELRRHLAEESEIHTLFRATVQGSLANIVHMLEKQEPNKCLETVLHELKKLKAFAYKLDQESVS